MPKPRLALIGHSFHQKTRSHDFLCAILEREFEVEIFWDDAWDGGSAVNLAEIADRFAYFVFFQIMYGRRAMKPLRGKNVTCMPMYDAVWETSDRFWRRFSGCKIFCFARVIHDRVTRLGLDAMYRQHFPAPEEPEINDDHERPVVYFWQRVNEVTWEHVRQLLPPDGVERVVINTSVDPGHTFARPGDDDVRDYRIEFVEWFERKEDYFAVLRETDLVIAPRLREGIGFSFLNAMARGKVIAAPDFPTANEYITPDTGFLFDPDHPAPLDLAGLADKARRMHAQFVAGRERWLAAEADLLDYVKRDPPGVRRKLSVLARRWMGGLFGR